MRVLYLALDINLNDVSGDAIHVREACRALALLGAEVGLVVPEIEGSKQRLEPLERSGVEIYSIPASGDIGTALICRALATKIRAGVVFERRFSPKIGVAVSRACNVPLVVEINGLPDVEMKILGKSPSGLRIVRVLKFRLLKWLFASANRVVAVTPGLAEAMQTRFRIPRERLAVISNGADVERFQPGDATAAKELVGLPLARATVGFVGTLYPWHGLHHLVAAAPSIVREIPNVLFAIVGDGPERHHLENLVRANGLEDHFRFLGRVDHAQVPAFLQSFDLCVHLVATELYPVMYGSSALKLYEYMACGRPIVAARYPGFEVIEEVDCGLLVNQCNPEEVSGAVVTLLQDSARRAAMGRRARQVAVERYSWESVGQQLLSVMEEVST